MGGDVGTVEQYRRGIGLQHRIRRRFRDDIAVGAAYNRARTELRGERELKHLAPADRSIETIAKALDETDRRVAMAVLKGLGFLSGGVHQARQRICGRNEIWNANEPTACKNWSFSCSETVLPYKL